MDLITEDLIVKFKEQGYTGDKHPSDIQIICKLFNPVGAGTWYLYDMINEDTFMCFANLGDPHMAECGSVSISELQGLTLPFGLTIDVTFTLVNTVWNRLLKL